MIGSVFLYLKKAFDLVDHQILLYKLKLYHFSTNTIKLSESYLANRSQRVKYGSTFSQMLTNPSGVPQGFILGPLLFILYINDLPMTVNSETDMYADDTTIHTANFKLEHIESFLQNDVNNISKWCTLNNMAINPMKTTCMIL